MNEFNKLFEKLSFKYYRLESFNDNLAKETARMIDLYLESETDEIERQTALYVKNCLEIYANYNGLCPMRLSMLLRGLQCVFNYHCAFSSVFKIPDTQTDTDLFFQSEKARNLENEIKELEEANEQTLQAINRLEYDKMNVKAIKTDKVRLENRKYSNDRLYNLIEQVDTLKRKYDHREKLIKYLKSVILQ